MRTDRGKALSAGAVLLMTGVWGCSVSAQYVDLEAERAAAQAAARQTSTNPGAATGQAGRPANPYDARPAQVYPATSFGVNNTADAVARNAPAAASGTVVPAAVGGPSDSAQPGQLYLQVQQLQQEVMRLNGKLEEQGNALRLLKEQSLQRYQDLDARLASGASTEPAEDLADAAPQAALVVDKPANAGGAQVGEEEAYRAAYALVQGRQFAQAIAAFQQFLQRYPDGEYAANSHYWLGELYLVQQPPDLEASRQSFALLLSQYPNSAKAPDALYKLGKVQFLKGNRAKARDYMDLVITQYDGVNNAVVKLARDFIAQNY